VWAENNKTNINTMPCDCHISIQYNTCTYCAQTLIDSTHPSKKFVSSKDPEHSLPRSKQSAIVTCPKRFTAVQIFITCLLKVYLTLTSRKVYSMKLPLCYVLISALFQFRYVPTFAGSQIIK